MSAKEFAYKELKLRILSAKWPEGEFLSEGAAAESVGTSRTPVREAFLRLEAEGLLRLVHQKGAFVPLISDREILETMEVRELIEIHCADLLVQRGVRLGKELTTLLREQRRLSGDPERFIECDRYFHRTFVSGAKNELLIEMYEGLRDRQLRLGLEAVLGSPGRIRQVIAEHKAIVDGLESGQAEVVREAIRQHLSATLQTIQGTRRPR